MSQREPIVVVTMNDAARLLDQNDGGDFWDGYTRRGEVTLVTGREKVGKSLVLLDLARRCWHGSEFPLGAPCPVGPGKRTLWCMGDRQHQQVRQRLDASGMPLDSVVLAAAPEAPLGCWRLDENEDVRLFARLVVQEAASLAFCVVDTAWSCAPQYKLHDPTDVGYYFGLLADLAAETGLPIFVSNHLNKDGNTLGLRSNGIARTIIKLSRADPEDRTRLRLDVDGNYRAGSPLGLFLLDDRVDYSADAPEIVTETESTRGPGRPPDKILLATAFLVRELAKGDQKGVEVIDLWVKSGENKRTLFNARDKLVELGLVVVDDTRKPQLWHLNRGTTTGQDDGLF